MKKKLTRKELERYNRKCRVSFFEVLLWYILTAWLAYGIKIHKAFAIPAGLMCLFATYRLIKHINFQSNLAKLTYFPLTKEECQDLGITNAYEIHQLMEGLLPLGYSLSHKQVKDLNKLFLSEDKPNKCKYIFTRKSPWKNLSLEMEDLEDLELV